MIVNVDQSNAWNGDEGLSWAAHQDRHDIATRRFTAELTRVAAVGETEHVLDVGCGCGQTTRDAARAAARGSALGVDLSAPMLERARTRAAEEGVDNVAFVQGDAQVHEFEPGAFDVVISRFGVMFFADPVVAFANIGGALRPGARLALIAWMQLDQNEWLTAIREALAMDRTLPSPPISSPGPFGLADPEHVRRVLQSAGFTDVDLAPFRSVIELGTDPDDAFAFVRDLPPVHSMVQDLDGTQTEQAMELLRGTLRSHATPASTASAWVITARRG
jgi:SAM-dependent methyltransferase